MSVEVTKLANGIHVLTHAMPHLETVALGVWVKAGARDERPEENGIAHFLEHMAFKGTARRSARDIAEEIESAGGEINASTGMETTTYYARVLKHDWALALDILADILTHSVLDPEELERERDVILQEIAAAHDQPDDLVFDLAQRACYGSHPLGRSILGTSTTVGSLSRDQIIAWRDRHYWGTRMVICAAGNIDHAELVAEAERLFGSVTAGDSTARQKPDFAPTFACEEKPLDQAHVVLAFSAPGYRDPDIYVLQVLSSILGGGMSSRLFQEVRENRGLCYSVFSFGSAYEDAGQLGVYAATSQEHARELMEVTTDVMLSVVRQVGEAEIARAKAQLKASLVMSLENASSRADQIARQFLAFGKVPPIATLVARVEAVTATQVRELAERLFAGRRPAFSAVGQISSLQPYEAIIGRFA
ncbi:MAG: insulinase family protein [Alphaproteobacteria bacterium]|nr:insulinase family protein [Alphaproteobacteria bacterium]